jgi:hypothetical protein
MTETKVSRKRSAGLSVARHRAEVPRGLSLRCRHRATVIAGGFRADDPRLGQRDHTGREKTGPWSRTLPRVNER